MRALSERDRVDFGAPGLSTGVVLDQWRKPSFDHAADAAVIICDGRLCAYGAVFTAGALAFVAPEHEGLGAGRLLLAWLERRERQLGRDPHRQRVAEANFGARLLLEGTGYRQARTVWQMVHDLRDLPAPPPAPAGVELTAIDPLADTAALHAADAAAFAANPDYVPESLEDFREEHLEIAELDPEASRVARLNGEIVGFTICQRLSARRGYIDLLAVTEEHRGQGLGRALLLGALHAFARAGLREGALEVASDNARGLRLYERTGMVRRHGAAIYEKPAARAQTTPGLG